MSRTYHHHWKYGKRHYVRLLPHVGPEPTWYSHLCVTVPNRRRDGRLLHRIAAGDIDADSAAFSVGSRRPHEYYW